MRPAGEIRQALLKAALVLTTPDRSPTLLELAHHAQVGYRATKETVARMRSAGQLRIVRLRRVSRRGRPVAEYGVVLEAPPAEAIKPCALSEMLATWSTPIA